MYYFRVDGNEKIGLGHMARCVCIAKKLMEYTKKLEFIISFDTDETILTDNNIKFYRLRDERCLGWSAVECASYISEQGYKDNVVFLDSYRIDEKAMKCLKETAKVYYLDDLATFDYPVDAIINYNIEADVSLYEPTKYDNRKMYLGPSFFPLRSEFKQYKKLFPNVEVRKVLITSSSTDPYETVYEIIKHINPMNFPRITFYIIKGKFFTRDYCTRLSELLEIYSNVVAFDWGQNMAKLLYEADLLIAPGSTVMLESFAVGTPCISYLFADNQNSLCEFAHNNNMATYLGDLRLRENYQKVSSYFVSELDINNRAKHFEAFTSLIDCDGCDRIVQILKEDL